MEKRDCDRHELEKELAAAGGAFERMSLRSG